jgi:hypothetical protein
MEGGFQQRKAEAILRDDAEIALDFDYGEPGERNLYNVVLRPVRKDFLKGEFNSGRAADASSGPVNCNVYKGANGFLLAGQWTENGYTDQWFAELSPATKQTRY